MKKKIVVFSGAGLDRDSGIETFRENITGLWENHKIEEVCTPEGWRKNRELVLKFYNERRKQLSTVEPNEAHKLLVKLEDKYDVIHVTQNVSDLLERAGVTNIIHLHGELTKVRGSILGSTGEIKPEDIIDIGYGEINIGDKCNKGSQLRPHICWFSEYPFKVVDALKSFSECDILIIIGTSLYITYTLELIKNIRQDGDNPCLIYFIDPEPKKYLDRYNMKVNYIEKTAVEGLPDLVNELLK